MKFTDDDLIAIEMDAKDQIEMNGVYEIEGDDFYALLARLEAAEQVCEEVLAGYDTWTREETKALIAKWRKIAGKE